MEEEMKEKKKAERKARDKETSYQDTLRFASVKNKNEANNSFNTTIITLQTMGN